MATLNITITVPDAHQARIVDAICDETGYDPAGGTKNAHIKRLVAAYLKRLVVKHEIDAARVAGEQTAQAGLADITID